jgi:hypothetical protein
VKIVDKYTEIIELNYEILHEFIDKIMVFEVDKASKTHKIEIFYNFIGVASMATPVKNVGNIKTLEYGDYDC